MRHVPDPEFPLSNILYRIPTGFYNTYWRNFEREAYACRHALRYIQQLGRGEFIPMASHKNKQTSFGVEFINIDLSDKQAETFQKWYDVNVAAIGKLTSEMCADGNKVGISFDGDNECFIVSITCKDEGSVNHNKCFTSRSDDWTEALGLALYKWSEVSQRGGWVNNGRKKNWG